MDADDAEARGGGDTAFAVANRLRVTWEGAWLAVGCAVFTGIGVALVAKGGTLDVVVGVLAIVLFGGGGLLAASRHLSRRPVLLLDAEGVRIPAPWPRSTADDLVLPWKDVTGVCACAKALHHRGGTVFLHYLVFLTGEEPPELPPSPWRPEPAVRIRPTWNRTVEEVLAEARRHKPDLPFTDRRPAPAGGR
ncbi:STM3941 family protein [Nocardiopsis chromatogenes]|uniref:STM3941 family protein n=1 Tax=Nocardiopsis chromatogenes TaxID=280239 RepID=UPI000345676F|nr:STM3941 family protein [Nocardiopsis chromatogenes]